MILIAFLIMVVAVSSTETVQWGNIAWGVECGRSSRETYTYNTARGCDGWQRTSLETCKRYCERNYLPGGCRLSRRPVCNYAIWDNNPGARPGWCQLATTCRKQRKGSSAVVGINRDVNECLHNNGGCNQICVNTQGSYQCRCRSGYTLSSNKRTCTDIDECLTNNGGCHQNFVCINKPGTHECSCRSGYTLSPNRKTCIDVNECSINNGGCQETCINKAGSFVCGCKKGYQLGSDKKTCSDVNECSSHNGGCSQTCTNTAGSFTCGCHKGYQLGCDKKTCSDTNECAVKNGGCDHICVNKDGSYHCKCVKGYALQSDGKTCSEGLRCKGVDNGCCTKSNPCNIGDGDCDHDYECVGSLVCGSDNCPWGDQDDCCMKKVPRVVIN